MRVKTSISVPEELLREIDRIDFNRSRFFERAARTYLAEIKKRRRDTRDAAILEAQSSRLSKEALDVLEYQNLK
jgi:metal-responsive CopG/Arc/MetJ family transcriptional regulator